MGRKLGRPTKFTEAFIDKAIEYLESYEEIGEVIPSIAGLAVYAKVSRDQLHAWASGEVPESATKELIDNYSDIFGTIAATQEQRLLNGGLSGRMNSTITKLILTKHGYSDRAETDLKSSDGSMSTGKELNITIVKSKGE